MKQQIATEKKKKVLRI